MSRVDSIASNYDFCICMGRFQPFHCGHLELVKAALNYGRQALILLGSHCAAPSLKNPWSSQERKQIINGCLEAEWRTRVYYIPIPDRATDAQWLTEIYLRILNVTEKQASIAIVGYNEEGSPYFLTRFPEWHYIEKKRFEGINATDIRAAYFSQAPETEYCGKLPVGTQNYLRAFKSQPLYQQLCKEFTRTSCQ